MTISRIPTGIFLTLALALIVAGCGNSTGPTLPAQVKMGFTLASTELASAVELVTLEITYPDGGTDLDTLNLVEGQINDTLSVPSGQELTFTLRAYSGGGVLLYEGSDTATPSTGQTVEINILLTPVDDILMLRAGPLFQSGSLSGGTVDVFVDVYNVDSLFGSAFRVDYDTTVLRFTGATEGTFLRGSPPYPTLGGVIKDSLNYVAYALTRVRDGGGTLAPGVNGSGRLTVLHFARVGVGTSAITFESAHVALQRPSGELVERSASLILESATVQVVGSN